jgi:hypothetical protein
MALTAAPRSTPLATDDLTLGAMALTLARQLAILKGSGMPAPNASLNHADNMAIGAALADGRAMFLNVLAQAFVDAATDLLSELEVQYGLPVSSDLSTAVRQARLTSKVRASVAGTPQSILAAVQPLVGVAYPGANIVENQARDCTAAPNAVFRWALILPGYLGVVPLDPLLDEVLQQMKPAHTLYVVGNKQKFLTNDPDSLTNLTLI